MTARWSISMAVLCAVLCALSGAFELAGDAGGDDVAQISAPAPVDHVPSTDEDPGVDELGPAALASLPVPPLRGVASSACEPNPLRDFLPAPIRPPPIA